MKTITTLIARNRNFTIVLKDNHYCAIEDKYITDGKINTQLNGLQVFASETIERCVELVRNEVEIDHLLENGATLAEAFSKVMNVPLELAEMLYN